MYICFRNNRCVALHTKYYVQYVCISPTIVRCDKKLLCNCDTNYCHINYCALVAQFFFFDYRQARRHLYWEAHNIGNACVRAYEHLCVSVYRAIMDLSFIYIAYKVVDRSIIFYN